MSKVFGAVAGLIMGLLGTVIVGYVAYLVLWGLWR